MLVGTRNPLNLGAAARAMSNFGALRLRVVSPYDLAFREARSAVGAETVLADAEVYRNVAEAVADCALVIGTTAVGHRELQHPLRRLDQAGGLIRAQLTSAPVAILFGSEKVGLSNEHLAHCHWLMHIPTRDQHLSMNLGQAVAIVLYELMRETKPATDKHLPKEENRLAATAGDLERITGLLLEALAASGYTNSASVAATEEKVRRMLRRMNPGARDSELWLGMLRQILWKLRAPARSGN